MIFSAINKSKEENPLSLPLPPLPSKLGGFDP